MGMLRMLGMGPVSVAGHRIDMGLDVDRLQAQNAAGAGVGVDGVGVDVARAVGDLGAGARVEGVEAGVGVIRGSSARRQEALAAALAAARGRGARNGHYCGAAFVLVYLRRGREREGEGRGGDRKSTEVSYG